MVVVTPWSFSARLGSINVQLKLSTALIPLALDCIDVTLGACFNVGSVSLIGVDAEVVEQSDSFFDEARCVDNQFPLGPF